MIVNQMGGKGTNARKAMAKPNKKSTTTSQQINSNRDAQIMEYNTRINALTNELAELKEKKELCQSLIGRIDSAIVKLYNACGIITEIVGNIENAINTTQIRKTDIEELGDIINDNATLLNSNKGILTEKSEEIQKEINEKQDLMNNLIAARDSL